MIVELTASAIEARLRQASLLAGSLRPEARLETKIDLGGRAIAARLMEASNLLELCRTLARARPVYSPGANPDQDKDRVRKG
jgi:hypothetical protein